MYVCVCMYVYVCARVQALKYTLTSPPIASSRKLSEQETLASNTLRPSSSKASNMDTSRPGQLLSEITFTWNPFCRVSTVTC